MNSLRLDLALPSADARVFTRSSTEPAGGAAPRRHTPFSRKLPAATLRSAPRPEGGALPSRQAPSLPSKWSGLMPLRGRHPVAAD